MPEAKASPKRKPPTKARAQAEKRWATSESLPLERGRDVYLPVKGEWVFVRFMGSTDAVEIAYLPEMARFSEIAAEKLLAPETPPDDSAVGLEHMKEYEREKARYMVKVAHYFVEADHENELPAEHCSDCGMNHPPSLWTQRQVNLLETADLSVITDAAERMEVLESLRPLLQATPDADSPEPADTGEQTQPTS